MISNPDASVLEPRLSPQRAFAVVTAFFFVMMTIGGYSAVAADNLNLPAGASAEIVNARSQEKMRNETENTRKPLPVDIDKEKKKEPEIESKPFFVKKIALTGDLLIPESEYMPVIQKYENRELTFADVRKVMDEIEAVFRAKGFLAVVSLPPQKMENQQINMELIISRMGKLTVEGNRWFNERLVLRHWDIKAGEYLKYDDIRRDAIAMSGNSDRVVRPVLKAGAEKRTTDVVLKVEDHFPLHADFTYDNQGVKLTGKRRPGFMVRHNNFLGLDDTMLVGTSFGSRFGALFASYSIPVTNFGTSLTGNFSHAQVNPKKEFEALGINSVSQTYGVGLRQDLFQNERFSGSMRTNFSFKDKYTRILSAVTSWDKARVLEIGGTLQERDSLGGTSLDQSISAGMPNRGDGYPLASRGGEHSFLKYHGNLSRQLKMPWSTYFLADGEWQLTRDRLLPQEQLFLGGAESVRGYPESDYGADQGAILQLEYWIPFGFLPEGWHLPFDSVDLGKRIKVLGFFDQGYGRIVNIRNDETRSSYLAGVGGGVDFAFRDNFSLRVEYGRRVGDRAVTEGGSNQIHFRLRSGI